MASTKIRTNDSYQLLFCAASNHVYFLQIYFQNCALSSAPNSAHDKRQRQKLSPGVGDARRKNVSRRNGRFCDPFFIINIVYGFCDGCVTEQSVVVAKWMHYSNSVFNPIVYACMNKEFRKAFCIILFGRKRCCRPRGRNETTDQTELTLGTNWIRKLHSLRNIVRKT